MATNQTQKGGVIGVMDSGVGGLTVVRELQRLLPGEDIVYLGDSANCPYGNKTGAEIVALSKKLLAYLGGQGAKVAAIACNTISTQVDTLIPCFDFKIVGIVSPAAQYVATLNIGQVGLIATEFTVQSKNYDKLIHSHNPHIQVIGKGSPLLAALVDRGDFNDREINAEITTQVDAILSNAAVRHVILGCTHYPIVQQNFERCYPNITFINPALEQARVVRDYLRQNGLLRDEGAKQGSLRICTTGDPQVYRNVAARLELVNITDACTVTLD